MEEPKVTHTKNTKKGEIGHDLGGTVVLDGTGAPCQIAAGRASRHSLTRFRRGLCLSEKLMQ